MSKSTNLAAQLQDATVTSSETTVPHNLGRIAQEAFVVQRGAAQTVYRGPTAWDVNNIYLQASGTILVRLLII